MARDWDPTGSTACSATAGWERSTGLRHPARPTCGAQVPAPRRVGRRASARAAADRGTRRIVAESSEHLHNLRKRQVDVRTVHRDGTAGRPDAPRADSREGPEARASAVPVHPDRRRPRRCSRERHGPPRHQAGEPVRRAAGPPQNPRLRTRQAPRDSRTSGRPGQAQHRTTASRGRPRPHAARARNGHSGLHVAGAGSRRDARLPQRPLQPRGVAVEMASGIQRI